MSSSKPNVLIVFADDLGYGDVGCYGATKLKTPHIDRIAENGVRFTNAYTPSSTCSQSRVSLLTGRYWWRSPLHPTKGVIAPAGPNTLLEKGIEALPKFFQKNGYRTAAFGKWHVGVGYGDLPSERYDWNRPTIEGGPLASGFDYFFGLAANVENEPAFYIENDTFVGRGPDDQIKVNGKKVTPWTPEVLYEDDEVGQDTALKAVEYIEHDPANKTPRQRENKDQLYDLENDPGEQRNVFSQHPEVAARLKKELSKVKPSPKIAKSTGNLLPEGKFDSMTGSDLPSEWQLKTFRKGNGVGTATVKAVKDNGNPCLKFTCEGGKWSLMSRGVDATVGTTYTLSLRAKAEGAPVDATLYLISPWDFVEQKTGAVTTEWKTYTMSVTPDQLGKGNNLFMRVDLEGVGSILIDDIKLISKVE